MVLSSSRKPLKSRIVGTHTVSDRDFLVTTAFKRRIQHTHIPAPPRTTVNSDAIVQQIGDQDQYYDTTSSDAHMEDECPAGVKITTKAKQKRYVNSVRTSLYVPSALGN